MGIGTVKERRYRAYLKWMERNVMIETKYINPTTDDNITLENNDYVKRRLLPKHLGNKIDIYV